MEIRERDPIQSPCKTEAEEQLLANYVTTQFHSLVIRRRDLICIIIH